MPSLSPKENYLRCLRREECEYVPLQTYGPPLATWAPPVSFPVDRDKTAFVIMCACGP